MSTLPITPGPVPPVAPPPVRPVRPPVSIADRVARAFPPLACVRGYRYFATKRVELAVRSDDEVDAEVKGKRTQTVKLRVEEGRLAAACTCSAKICGPAACRHVWATLLEIDRRGAFESLRSSHRALALVPLVTEAAPKRKPTVKKKRAAR